MQRFIPQWGDFIPIAIESILIKTVMLSSSKPGLFGKEPRLFVNPTSTSSG